MKRHLGSRITILICFQLFFFVGNILAKADDGNEWFLTAGKARAVVLLAHGLNLKPEKMDFLGRWLQSQGVDVYRVSLTGHKGDLGDFGKVTRDLWVQEMVRFSKLAQSRAQSIHVPFYFVGYSLGALVYSDAVTAGLIHSDRNVLFAPPYSIEVPEPLIKTLAKTKGLDYMLPSRNLEEYRANRGTTMAAYLALLESKHNVVDQNLKGLNVPTLMIVSPRDELIDYTKQLELLRINKMDQWTILEVQNDNCQLSKCYNHLVIDDKSLNQGEWPRVQEALSKFLFP